MPIHDWSKAPAGLFQYFHSRWIGELCDVLNFGALPGGYMAIGEMNAVGLFPDVQVGIASRPVSSGSPIGATTLPKTRFVSHPTEAAAYAARANRIAIRTQIGDLVAIVEIVSPGNKDSRHRIRLFRDKVVEFLTKGIHVSIVDLFPPSPRDPLGIHKYIWDELREEPFELPVDKPLTLASYVAEPVIAAYVEPVAVGDSLPPLPVFLEVDFHISLPLEEPYLRAWEKFPEAMKAIVAGRSA